jgi:chemotaxis protein MotB
MPRRTEPDELDDLGDENTSDWQTTYMDTVTILLAFFVILASLANVDIITVVGTRNPETHQQRDPAKEMRLFFPIEALSRQLNTALAPEIDAGLLTLDKKYYEIRLLFAGDGFFRSGEANMLPEGRSMVQRTIEQISKLSPQDFKVDIEGHTDSAPIKTARFNDNWELSTARAANVLSYFLAGGISSKKLKASGYADTFPVAADRDSTGRYLPELQDQNRRIVVRLYFDE